MNVIVVVGMNLSMLPQDLFAHPKQPSDSKILVGDKKKGGKK